MSKVEHLSKSPLIEATFYVEGASRLASSKENLEVVSRQIIPFFDSVKILSADQIKGQVAAMSEPDSSGYAIVGESTKQRRGVLIKSNLFSYSVLDQYKDWDAFISEAWGVYEKYRECFSQIKVLRAGVRSVNRFSEFSGLVPFDRVFLRASDEIERMDVVPVECVLRNVLYHKKVDLFSITRKLTRTRFVSGNVFNSRFLFDIDVFALEKKGMDTKGIRDKFDLIHELKNRIFFDSIQPSIIDELR